MGVGKNICNNIEIHNYLDMKQNNYLDMKQKIGKNIVKSSISQEISPSSHQCGR